MVLAGKKMVELASECYHRGWMLDEVLAQGWCAPAGPHPAADVRRVIDKILRDVPVAKSPITEALKVGYDASREALQQAFDKLKARLTRLRGGVPPERVAREARDGADLGSVVDALRRALDDVPRDHFDGLRERLAARLGA